MVFQYWVKNLKKLNSFINAPHFKMEGIHTLKSLLQKGDWLVKIDLKDVYFSVPISKAQRKFLCFQLRDRFYQFNCLPFGPASAPWVFTKTLKRIAALGRELGIWLNCLHRRHSPDGRNQGETQRSSFGSDIPTTVPRFPCKHGKDSTGSVSIPRISGFHGRYYQDGTEPSSSKNKKDSGGVPTDIRGGACNSPHPLQIDWQNECHKPGDPTSSSVLQEPTNGPDNGSKESKPGFETTHLNLSPDSREELIWWDTQMIKWNGRTVLATEPDLTIESDASSQGWGVSCQGTSTGDLGLLWRRNGT